MRESCAALVLLLFAIPFVGQLSSCADQPPPTVALELRHTEDPAVVGPTFESLEGTPVPVMYGPQGPGAYLPFVAVLPADTPLRRDQLRTTFRLRYPALDDDVVVPLARQKLVPCEDPAFADHVQLWGYVALLPEPFWPADVIEAELDVTLEDPDGARAVGSATVLIQWEPEARP